MKQLSVDLCEYDVVHDGRPLNAADVLYDNMEVLLRKKRHPS